MLIVLSGPVSPGPSPTAGPSAVQRGGPGAYGQAGDTPPGPGSILGITPPAQLMNDYCSLVADPDVRFSKYEYI